MPEAAGMFQITSMQAGLVLASLACCMGCLYMVFYYGRQVQTSAYIRESLVAASKAEELRTLMRDIYDNVGSDHSIRTIHRLEDTTQSYGRYTWGTASRWRGAATRRR
jgi:hypothetical protein